MSENKPFLSVIIPAYNVENWIEQCICSVLQISDFSYEIIIIDDGSRDRTMEIIKHFQKLNSKIIKAFYTENKGLSSARNLGVSNACGEYILFVDSDDFIDPIEMTKLLHNLSKINVDICLYNGFKYIENQQPIRLIKDNLQLKNHNNTNGTFFLEKLLNLSHEHIAVWGKIFSTKLLKQNNITFPAGIKHEDITYIFMTFLAANKVSYIEYACYYYRQRENSITSNPDINNIKGRVFSVKQLLDIFKSNKINNRTFNDYLIYQLNRTVKYMPNEIKSSAFKLLFCRSSLKKKVLCLMILAKALILNIKTLIK